MAEYKVSVPAGPIWDNDDAKKKCPIVCATRMGEWTGQWSTVVDSKMSLCECEIEIDKDGTDEFSLYVVAGPIWSNEDAQEKCPIVCASYGGEWTGQWKTNVEGKMSICECRFKI